MNAKKNTNSFVPDSDSLYSMYPRPIGFIPGDWRSGWINLCVEVSASGITGMASCSSHGRRGSRAGGEGYVTPCF